MNWSMAVCKALVRQRAMVFTNGCAQRNHHTEGLPANYCSHTRGSSVATEAPQLLISAGFNYKFHPGAPGPRGSLFFFQYQSWLQTAVVGQLQ